MIVPSTPVWQASANGRTDGDAKTVVSSDLSAAGPQFMLERSARPGDNQPNRYHRFAARSPPPTVWSAMRLSDAPQRNKGALVVGENPQGTRLPRCLHLSWNALHFGWIEGLTGMYVEVAAAEKSRRFGWPLICIICCGAILWTRAANIHHVRAREQSLPPTNPGNS